ncbi:MAG: transcriptional regulator, family, partial [Humibacillus sp.]|nr:transcriptional regulator, family [Humibacillus sp.]
RDPVVLTDTLHALGRALVHSVRGYDGEGSIVLHHALGLVRGQKRPAVEGDVLRELAFVDVQAGRHTSAARTLSAAMLQADLAADDALRAGVLALQGMNSADLGRHVRASDLLSRSAATAANAGQVRQQAWSLGVLARSLLLGGDPTAARAAADESIGIARRERWNAFLPWPQVLHAQTLVEEGRRDAAKAEAEEAFALACELGDPCWEGMAARALGLIASQDGDRDGAHRWLAQAHRRADRVSDRYVWVSAYVGLADLHVCRAHGDDVRPAAQRLHDAALRADLPELLAWALVHLAESGDTTRVGPAQAAAAGLDDPALKARAEALGPSREDVHDVHV